MKHPSFRKFSNFGTSPKNLVFEYKFDGVAEWPDENKNSLGYTPLVSGSSSVTIERVKYGQFDIRCN